MSNTDINNIQPQANDLVVVPEGTQVPTNVPFMVYAMKFLASPSIIRTGGYQMGVLTSITNSTIGNWLGLKPISPEKVSLRDIATTQLPSASRRDSTISLQLDPKTTAGTDTAIEKIPEKQKPGGFFRYARPIEYLLQEDRSFDLTVGPKGGLTIYVELDPEHKTFAFSYALCHTGDNFNKSIARKIAKQRFENDDWYEIRNYDLTLSVMENLRLALFNLLERGNGPGCEVDETEVVFSSLSERTKEYELKQIYERI